MSDLYGRIDLGDVKTPDDLPPAKQKSINLETCKKISHFGNPKHS